MSEEIKNNEAEETAAETPVETPAPAAATDTPVETPAADAAATDTPAETPAADAAATDKPAEGSSEQKPVQRTDGQRRDSRPDQQRRPGGGRPDQRRDGRPPRRDGQRMPRFRRKVCRFCHDKEAVIDYKKTNILESFITDRGKILPRRVTGTCAKHQRAVAREIKRARIIALLPFVEQ